MTSHGGRNWLHRTVLVTPERLDAARARFAAALLLTRPRDATDESCVICGATEHGWLCRRCEASQRALYPDADSHAARITCTLRSAEARLMGGYG